MACGGIFKHALHKRRVYTLCLRMLGNVSNRRHDPGAFLHLFRKIGSFLEITFLPGFIDLR
jgi:hypothetical protein